MRLAGAFGVLLTALVLAGAAQAAQPGEKELPAPAPAPDDALTDALESGRLTEAEYALERARSLFQLGRVRREFGDVERAGPRDATLILRDLALRRQELTGADRAVARGILARPDGGGVEVGNGWSPGAVTAAGCGAHLCVHWVETTVDAPPGADGDPDTIPPWIVLVGAAWEDAWTREIDDRGYKPPLPDSTSANHGPDPSLDVYVEDLGPSLVFGYCTTDDPTADEMNPAYDPLDFSVSAYCVVDDDFLDFGNEHTPLEFLEVTTAHEFQHASQFAYDFLEDGWLMEGTATNMEEDLWPTISDNVNFLRSYSPLSRPSSPLDRWGLGNSEYGSWIFFRFLQEKLAGGNPAIIREIWERADASDEALFGDQYSLRAVRTELVQRGYVFADVFARFGRTNRLLAYADDALAEYPRVPATFARTLGRRSPNVRPRSWRINHLGTRVFTFRPGKGTTQGRLRVRVELPRHGSSYMRASVIVVKADSSTATRVIRANAKRIARTTTPFDRRDIRRVDVVLSNGSTRTACWLGVGPPYYSCMGTPRDDGRVFRLSASLR
jgi:hypothetical protein